MNVEYQCPIFYVITSTKDLKKIRKEKIMKLIKKQSKQTYTNKNKETKHYYNYFLQFDNGKRVQVKPAFKDDTRTLDAVAEYESTSNNSGK